MFGFGGKIDFLEEKQLAMQIGQTENNQIYHEWAEGNEIEDMEI